MIDRRSIRGGSISSFRGSVVSSNSARGLTGNNPTSQRPTQKRSSVHKLLQYIDIYPMKIEMHVENKFRQPTHCGGVLSVFTYLVMAVLILIKGRSIQTENGFVSQPESNDQAILAGRRLQDCKDETVQSMVRFLQDTNQGDGQAKDEEKDEDKKNIYFWTYRDEDFNPNNYGNQDGLLAMDYGVDKVTVSINLQSAKDKYDAEMSKILDKIRSVNPKDAKAGKIPDRFFTGNAKKDEAFA
jgi:hypothetical protein